MRHRPDRTWLLLLLILLPAGALALLGYRGAEALAASEAERMRTELRAAERHVRNAVPRVSARLEEQVIGRMTVAADELARVMPLTGPVETLRTLSKELMVHGLWTTATRVVDARGVGIHPAEYLPRDVAAVTTRGDVPDLLEHLRRRAERARWSTGGIDAPLRIWEEAQAKLESPVLKATADVEMAHWRMRGSKSPWLARTAARTLEAHWPEEVLQAVGRPWVLLLMMAATDQAPLRDGMLDTFLEGGFDEVPLTREERRRLRRLMMRSRPVIYQFGQETSFRIEHLLSQPSVTLALPIAQGARLEVDLAPETLLRAVRREVRRSEGWGENIRFTTRAALQSTLPTGAVVATLGGGVVRPVTLTAPAGVAGEVLLLHRDWQEARRTDSRRRRLAGAGVACLFVLCLLGLLFLRRTVKRERVARRMRDDFIANVTHEVRTPLTSVLMHTEMLAEQEADADRRRAWGRIVQAEGRRLEALVDDLLDFAALERGTRQLEPAPVDLAAACREAGAPFLVLAEREGIQVEVDAPDGALEAMADPAALSRILANLMSNAWKHGRPPRDGGDVRVRLRCFEDGGRPVVEVRDNGPGIPPGERDWIFQRFGRGRGAARTQGTGIGLALSRDLARAMDGDLDVRDDGRETAFRLVLPSVPEIKT